MRRHDIVISADGDRLRRFVDDEPVCTATDKTCRKGEIGIFAFPDPYEFAVQEVGVQADLVLTPQETRR